MKIQADHPDRRRRLFSKYELDVALAPLGMPRSKAEARKAELQRSAAKRQTALKRAAKWERQNDN